MSTVNVIYAESSNGIIGKDNTIPWKNKTDMAYFKSMTTGSNVIMGYNTYKGFNGRALPNRTNYVIVKDKHQKLEGDFKPVTVSDLPNLIGNRPLSGDKDWWVIGGTKTYELFYDLHLSGAVTLNTIHRCVIKEEVGGDTFAPEKPSSFDFLTVDKSVTVLPSKSELDAPVELHVSTLKGVNKGLLIVLDGMDGSGKTSALNYVHDYLKEKGHVVHTAQDPGTTPIAYKLRELVKFGECGDKAHPTTEVMLFMAARNELIEKIIKPSLHRGHTLVLDRFMLSTEAFQGALGLEQEINTLKTVLDLPEPDLTIYMDVDYETAMSRVDNRGGRDYIESRGQDYFNNAREIFITKTHGLENGYLVDARSDFDTVRANVLALIEEKVNH